MPNILTGITTAPRPETDYLAQTIASFIATHGWTPFRYQLKFYAEPGSQFSAYLPLCDWYENELRLGNWLNWKSAAEQLLSSARDSWMTHILICEDDIVFAKNTFERLNVLLPQVEMYGNFGYLSLYTSGTHHRRVRRQTAMTAMAKKVGDEGNFAVMEDVQRLWGACAMVFSVESLEKILDTRAVRNWTGLKTDPPGMPAGRDIVINEAARERGLHSWFMRPSCVQHIGVISTIGNNEGLTSGRRATDFKE